MNKNEYEKLSDLQLNRMIAFDVKCLTPDKAIMRGQDVGEHDKCNFKNDAVSVNDEGEIEFHDYCNNWADMGALIDKHRINLIFGEFECYAAPFNSFKSSEQVEHKNPLRVAAIVYLMMQEGE